MMKPSSSAFRIQLLAVILVLYLLPVVALAAYSMQWNVFSYSLAGAFAGSLALFWLMTRWEMGWRAQPEICKAAEQESLPVENAQELEEAQAKNIQLKEEADRLIEEMRFLVEERNRYHQLAEKSQGGLQQQQQHIQKLQDNLAEQKALIEKKQQQIGILETKVGDLAHEIKTLLRIAEAHSSAMDLPSPSKLEAAEEEDPVNSSIERLIRSPAEASFQLKRCLDIAQKITGSHRFGARLHSFDSPADSFTIDLRRLCDSLRCENSCSILLYSPKENQLLFANQQIKVLTGWSADKFVQNFKEILQDENPWKQGVYTLGMSSETEVKLALKNKSGNEAFIHARMGMIPTGIFRNHIIAILYASTGPL